MSRGRGPAAPCEAVPAEPPEAVSPAAKDGAGAAPAPQPAGEGCSGEPASRRFALSARLPSTVRASGKDYLFIALGTLLTAVALDAFLVPGQLAAGGASGLATIIYYLTLDWLGFGFPVGMQTLVMNALLLIPVYRSGGLRYASRTIFGIVTLSVFTDLLAPFIPPLAPDNVVLECLWGGLISGLGLGLAFRAGGNTGGTDIVAQLLAKHTSVSVGTWMLVVDSAIVVGSVSLFGFEVALCAALTIVVTSLVIDYVVDGPSTEKVAWIISPRHEEIAQAVMTQLDRGCTRFDATGMWSKEPRPVLFVVLSRREVGDLKRLIVQIDREAVVAIANMHETFGEGFKDIGLQQ